MAITPAKPAAPAPGAPKPPKANPKKKPKQKQGLVYTHPKSMRFKANRPSFWVVIVVFILTAIIAGTGTYFYQDYFYTQEIQNLEKQIAGLHDEVETLVRLAGLRSEEEIVEILACPNLKISEAKNSIFAAGLELEFTVAASDEEEIWEITDVMMDPECERFAWSTITTFPVDGTSISQIFVADLEGAIVDTYDMYEEAYNINFEFFEGNKIVYSYRPTDYVEGDWWNELARPMAILDISSELIDEWGEAYDFSRDLAYIMVKRDGRDLLIDAGANKDEIAVLSQDGTDEAIDYVFSPESKNVAYIFFNNQPDPNFFQEYFTYCQAEPIIGGVKLWNLRTRKLQTLDTSDVQGMRLLQWLDEESIRYSTLTPQPQQNTLVIP